MRTAKRYLIACLCIFWCLGALGRTKTTNGSQAFVWAVKKVTDVMVHDVTSPVAASRYYAYLLLGANEVQVFYKPETAYSFAGQVNAFKGLNLADNQPAASDEGLAAQLFPLMLGNKLLPSGFLLQPVADSVAAHAASAGMPRQKVQATMALVQQAAVQIVAYANSDGFTRLTNLRRYTPLQAPGFWQPTGPAFMAPVEPHWNTLRTFVIDSAQQFKPAPPAPYDTAASSSFIVQLKQVYQVVKDKEPHTVQQAMFWDCNPFAVEQLGHVQFGLKKISPGGHWIGIAGIACLQQKYSLQKTIIIHALVAVALADAFIACWDEKYRSNRIRPETAINRLIDPRWRPLLQTPPFPEYVSGHSVASTAAAAILSNIVGDSVAFVDDTEVEFDLPKRKFTSFNAAAHEAAMSRLYGGIHYLDAIEQGVWQGRAVAGCAFKKLPDAFASARGMK